MTRDRIKKLVILLSIVTSISAGIANYPTYYVLYKYGVRAFFAGVLVTQYSVRMSAIDIVAIISSLACLFYARRYFSDSRSKRRISTSLLILVTILSALLNYPTYYVAYHYGLSSLAKGVIITQYSARSTAILALLLAIQIYFLVMLRASERSVVVEKHAEKLRMIIDQSEMLRIKLWRERNRNSRLLGLTMLIFSGVLFVVSYESAIFVYEVGALASFMVGAALILTQLEPRVKLYPASDALLGPLLALANQLKRNYGKYQVEFVADEEKSYMKIKQEDKRNDNLVMEPIGAGLVRSYEREIGELYNKGQEYVVSWLTKAISQGLGLAEHVEIRFEDKTMYSILSKPYVRSLCVQKEMTDNVCNTMGCPLVASIAESMAKATGKEVIHLECKYNPATQTAVARHKIED